MKKLSCGNCNNIFKCPNNKRNKNRIYCSEYCAKSANGKNNKGKKRSQEFREELSKRIRGSRNPFYGKTHTQRTKDLISKANTRSHNKEIILNKKQIAIFNGLMLGDGHLNSNNVSGRYSQGCKYKEFLEHITQVLPLDWGPIWEDKKWNCYHIKSHFTPSLLNFRKKWYLNGKKVVPKNLKLSKEEILYWFLGDGSIWFPHKKGFPKSKYFEIKFATDGFTKNDNLLLISKLKDVGIKSSLLSRNQIRILSESKEDFFKLIGMSPIECYDYKWRCIN